MVQDPLGHETRTAGRRAVGEERAGCAECASAAEGADAVDYAFPLVYSDRVRGLVHVSMT